MRATKILQSMLAAMVLLGGCKTMIQIRGVKPAEVNLGPAKELAVLHTEGRRSAKEAVIEKLSSKARSGGYFQVTDRSEEGLEVKLAGRNVTVEGSAGGLGTGQIGLRLDVLEWEAERDTEDRQVRKTVGSGKNKKTVTETKSVRVHKGNVLLGVTLFDELGRALWAEKEITGTSSLENSDKDSAIEAAADSAISQILASITPKPYTAQVELDTDDAQQEAIIETAKSGAIAQARDDMKKYLEANPNNAGAAYNLAVFVEATGDYAKALEYYDKALSLGNKPLYTAARAACAKRVADSEALLAKGE